MSLPLNNTESSTNDPILELDHDHDKEYYNNLTQQLKDTQPCFVCESDANQEQKQQQQQQQKQQQQQQEIKNIINETVKIDATTKAVVKIDTNDEVVKTDDATEEQDHIAFLTLLFEQLPTIIETWRKEYNNTTITTEFPLVVVLDAKEKTIVYKYVDKTKAEMNMIYYRTYLKECQRIKTHYKNTLVVACATTIKVTSGSRTSTISSFILPLDVFISKTLQEEHKITPTTFDILDNNHYQLWEKEYKKQILQSEHPFDRFRSIAGYYKDLHHMTDIKKKSANEPEEEVPEASVDRQQLVNMLTLQALFTLIRSMVKYWRVEYKNISQQNPEIRSETYPFLIDFNHLKYQKDKTTGDKIPKKSTTGFLYFHEKAHCEANYYRKLLRETKRLRLNYNNTFSFVSHRPNEDYDSKTTIYDKFPYAFMLPLLPFIPREIQEEHNLTSATFNIHEELHYTLWDHSFQNYLFKTALPFDTFRVLVESQQKSLGRYRRICEANIEVPINSMVATTATLEPKESNEVKESTVTEDSKEVKAAEPKSTKVSATPTTEFTRVIKGVVSNQMISENDWLALRLHSFVAPFQPEFESLDKIKRWADLMNQKLKKSGPGSSVQLITYKSIWQNLSNATISKIHDFFKHYSEIQNQEDFIQNMKNAGVMSGYIIYYIQPEKGICQIISYCQWPEIGEVCTVNLFGVLQEICSDCSIGYVDIKPPVAKHNTDFYEHQFRIQPSFSYHATGKKKGGWTWTVPELSYDTPVKDLSKQIEQIDLNTTG